MCARRKPEIFGLCTHKQTGIKHEKTGKPCEDFVSSSRSYDSGVASISLSDGAGSCKHAFYGASIASQEAARILAYEFESLWRMPKNEAAEYLITEICRPIRKTAETRDWKNESMYATVLCVAKHPDERFIAFHVGDGVITAYSPEKGCEVLSQYEHTIASNVTNFINEPNTEYNIVRGQYPYVSFFLTSDGAEPYLVPSGQVSAPVLLLQQAAFILPEKSMKHYMSMLMESIRTQCCEYDDLSFALLSDFRKTGSVSDDMTNKQLCNLMNIDMLPDNRRKFCMKLIEILHLFPEGVSVNSLSKIFYTHKESIFLKKLSRLFGKNDFIEYGRRIVFLK